MPRCSAIKPDGERCRVSVEPPDDMCWAHHPRNRDQRRRITSRAGKSKASRELGDLKTRLSELADGVLEGSTDKAVGAVVSQIINVHLRAVELERRAKTTDELAAQIAELRERIEGGRRAAL